jgi:hypothetical protein
MDFIAVITDFLADRETLQVIPYALYIQSLSIEGLYHSIRFHP